MDILLREMEFSFSRSGGKGGQNVNKVETKVTVRWDFENSPILSEEKKTLIRTRLAGRLDKDGKLMVSAQNERTQKQNRARAVEILQKLVKKALFVAPSRMATKVSRAEKEKRLYRKREVAKKKELRRKIEWT